MEENKKEKADEILDETIDETEEEITEEEITEEEINEEKNLLKEAEDKAAMYLDKFQRTLAEFDNFRKRTAKEKASMYDDGVRDTIEKLLPTVDNLERALASAKDSADSGLYKGIEMVLKQLRETLNGMGVTEIASVGESFDPNLHSAVSHIEDENLGENEISVEMLKGYKYKDKVIRYAMVQVAN